MRGTLLISSRLSQTQIKFRGHSYKKRRGKYFIQSQAFYSVCMQSYRSLSNASLLIDFPEHWALASHALLACTLFSSHCHRLYHSDLLQEHEGRADFDVTHLITRCNYFRWRCSYLRQPPRSTCSPDEVCSLVLFAVLSSSVRWEIGRYIWQQQLSLLTLSPPFDGWTLFPYQFF